LEIVERRVVVDISSASNKDADKISKPGSVAHFHGQDQGIPLELGKS